MPAKRPPPGSLPTAATAASRPGVIAELPLRDRFGVCQWFHYEDYAALEMAIRWLRRLGVRHLRTGISWADYFRPNGKVWCDVMMQALAEFDVLLSVWHTPPSIAEGGCCASPPRRLLDYADFVDLLITDYGSTFSHLELWNEPNNRYKWDFERFDPGWLKFAEMIGSAAYWSQQRGVPTVLGGMIPVDHHWLELMKERGVLAYIDKIGIHAFPGMWWDGSRNWEWHRDWHGWPDKIGYIESHGEGRPIWVTETGLATYDLGRGEPGKYDLQTRMLEAALQAPAERVYWYSLIDLSPEREAIEGFHIDENEYHLGLVTHDGHPKPAFAALQRALAES